MTDQAAQAGAQLLARARAVIQGDVVLDRSERSSLVDDLNRAEAHFVAHGVPWPTELHVGRISHEHGHNQYATLHRQSLIAEMAEYCREWWSDINDPRDADELPDEDVVSAYFAKREDETHSTCRISIPDHPPAQPSTLRVRHYLVADREHIRPATANLLDQWARLLPEERPLGVAATGHGWFVLTDQLEESDRKLIPEELLSLLDFARLQGCRNLLLDAAGDAIDGVDLYYW